MSVKVAKGCAICGPIMIVLFLIGFLGIARFVPPPSPNLTAQQTLQMYLDRQFPIRLGLWIATLGAAFLGPYFAVISEITSRGNRCCTPAGWWHSSPRETSSHGVPARS